METGAEGGGGDGSDGGGEGIDNWGGDSVGVEMVVTAIERVVMTGVEIVWGWRWL